MFPKIGVPENGLVYSRKSENPIKMDDLGVPLFLETPRWFSGIMKKIPIRGASNNANVW